MSELTAAQEILIDGFNRVAENVEAACSGLTLDDAVYRPTEEANSIDWLIWHLTRVQDDHICGVSGQEQAWTANGWYDKAGLPFDASAHGYGHGPAEVAAVRLDPKFLEGYHADVHARTIAFVRDVSDADLASVIDERWDPPVTMSVRLVSVIDDCTQHIGQAAYLRGLIHSK